MSVILADLNPATVATLRALLPEPASLNNPVDTTAAVDADTFDRCIAAVRADLGVDAVIAATVRTAVGDPIVALATIAEGDKHGVILDVRDKNGVRTAVRELAERFGAALRGVLLQPMAARSRELLVGMHSDGVFGPLVVFGLGGVDTDVIADRTARLVPLGDADADDLLHGLRCSVTLFGPHAAPVLDIGALRDVMLRVSLLAQLLPEVIELDLNPLIASPDGCQTVDARIRLAPSPTVGPFLPGLRG